MNHKKKWRNVDLNQRAAGLCYPQVTVADCNHYTAKKPFCRCHFGLLSSGTSSLTITIFLMVDRGGITYENRPIFQWPAMTQSDSNSS